MSETTPARPSPPPYICPVCLRSQLHHPLDAERQVFYCEHNAVLVVADAEPGKWRIRQRVDQASYRSLIEAVERLTVIASAGGPEVKAALIGLIQTTREAAEERARRRRGTPGSESS